MNLFSRALNQDPLTVNFDNLLPFLIIPYQGVSKGGIDGELELLINTHLRVGRANDDHDDTGDDLNHIVQLLIAKLRYPSLISDNATQEYMNQRAHSFGSFLGAYYAHYGDDMTDYKKRIIEGIAAGWRPDVSAPAGAVRWYHRPNSVDDGHPNPQLSTLYSAIIDRLLK